MSTYAYTYTYPVGVEAVTFTMAAQLAGFADASDSDNENTPLGGGAAPRCIAPRAVVRSDLALQEDQFLLRKPLTSSLRGTLVDVQGGKATCPALHAFGPLPMLIRFESITNWSEWPASLSAPCSARAQPVTAPQGQPDVQAEGGRASHAGQGARAAVASSAALLRDRLGRRARGG